MGSGTYVGVIYAYPQYKARIGRVISLEERIHECVEPSLNGKALPPQSAAMKAIQVYISWLSQHVSPPAELTWLRFPALSLKDQPDTNHGARLFERSCAGCHGADGHGTEMAHPPWGPHFFNIASGLARMSQAAAFIKGNMPITRPGTFSDADTFDIAAFVNSHPRPDYPPKMLDYPKGGKPTDVPY